MAVCSTSMALGKTKAQAIIAETVSPSPQPNGELTLAHTNSLEQALPSSEPGKAVIIFTFDDGHASDYLLAYPILKPYDIKGTSYINTKYTDQGLKGRLSWDQIREMAGYGWVFGAHTSGHQRMTRLTDKEIASDCEAVNQSFIAQGFAPPVIMAYPYGAHSDRVIKAMKPFYKQARLAAYRTDCVDPANTDPYKIPSVSADMQTKGRLNKVKRLVDKACEKSAVVIFRVHVLYKDHPYDTVKRNSRVAGGCAPQTDSKLFAELVEYCAKKGCAFMTMTELMDNMDAQQAADSQRYNHASR